MNSQIAVVGVGNPFRGDDGAGWAVIDGLKKKKLEQISLWKNRADLAELLEIFERNSIVYIVDACLIDAPVGFWQRIDALNEPIPDPTPTSTHGFSLCQIIALAGNLHRLPAQLIFYVISGKSYQMSNSLSHPVSQAVCQVTNEIYSEIKKCTKHMS
jgi:hydrogenase maturation protease